MNVARCLLVAASVLSLAPAARADLLLKVKVHTDPTNLGGVDKPASDTVETIWIGAGAVRRETSDATYIYVASQKKFYVLDVAQKTVSTFTLPIDLVKDSGPETRLTLEGVGERMRYAIEVTPAAETKKINQWTAHRFDVSMTNDVGVSVTETIWTTKDIPVDAELWRGMTASVLSLNPGFEDAGPELSQIEGVPVLTEMTIKGGPTSYKQRQELNSVEKKTAPAGTYSVPADFTETAFNPLKPSKRS